MQLDIVFRLGKSIGSGSFSVIFGHVEIFHCTTTSYTEQQRQHTCVVVFKIFRHVKIFIGTGQSRAKVRQDIDFGVSLTD